MKSATESVAVEPDNNEAAMEIDEGAHDSFMPETHPENDVELEGGELLSALSPPGLLPDFDAETLTPLAVPAVVPAPALTPPVAVAPVLAPAIPAPIPVPVCEGYVDGLDPRWNVVGWARMPGVTETRLRVALMVGGRAAVTDTAERFRGDLLAAQYGDGKYGFQLAIPPSLFDGGRHTLEVQVLGNVQGAMLGQLDIVLPTRLPRRAGARVSINAAALVAGVLGTATTATTATTADTAVAQLEAYADDLTAALARVAMEYDIATAIGLLYIHVLRRRVDDGGLQTRLTRLSRNPGEMADVVREVVLSDEAAKVLYKGAALHLPELEPIRAWTRLRPFN